VTTSLDTIRNNLTNCMKTHIKLICGSCNEPKIIPMTCGIRICPKCQSIREWRLRKKYKPFLKLFKNPKLLTLTFRGYTRFDKKTKRRCDLYAYNFFRRLGNKVKFGIRVMELISQENDSFFIHYHCLVEMQYIPQKRLSDLWLKVTKSSFIVDIRKVSIRWGLSYVLKYVTKPTKLDISLDVYKEIFYKTRLLTVFGNMYGKIYNEKYMLTCSNCGGGWFEFGGIYGNESETSSEMSKMQTFQSTPHRTVP